MARKHHAKHSKNTILASSAAKPFSKLSVGAASAVAAASLALSAAPALAQVQTPVKSEEVTATSVKADTVNSAKNTDTVKKEAVKKEQVGGG